MASRMSRAQEEAEAWTKEDSRLASRHAETQAEEMVRLDHVARWALAELKVERDNTTAKSNSRCLCYEMLASDLERALHTARLNTLRLQHDLQVLRPQLSEVKCKNAALQSALQTANFGRDIALQQLGEYHEDRQLIASLLANTCASGAFAQQRITTRRQMDATTVDNSSEASEWDQEEDDGEANEAEVRLPDEIQQEELVLVREVAGAYRNGQCAWLTDPTTFPAGVRPLLRRWLSPENYADASVFVDAKDAQERQCIQFDFSCVAEAVANGAPLLLCIQVGYKNSWATLFAMSHRWPCQTLPSTLNFPAIQKYIINAWGMHSVDNALLLLASTAH